MTSQWQNEGFDVLEEFVCEVIINPDFSMAARSKQESNERNGVTQERAEDASRALVEQDTNGLSGYEIVYVPSTNEVRFLRAIDVAFLKEIICRSNPGTWPFYEPLLASFKDVVRDTFAVKNGMIVVADRGRLVHELTTFALKLVLVIDDSQTSGKTAAMFTQHLLVTKFNRIPNNDAMLTAIKKGRVGDVSPLKDLLEEYIPAADQPIVATIEKSDEPSA